MNILGNYDPIRSDRPVSPVSPRSIPGQVATTPAAPVSKTVSVPLCDTGMTMSCQHQTASCDTLAPERTAELRRKVLERAYCNLDVVDHVARRLLQRGDL